MPPCLDDNSPSKGCRREARALEMVVEESTRRQIVLDTIIRAVGAPLQVDDAPDAGIDYLDLRDLPRST